MRFFPIFPRPSKGPRPPMTGWDVMWVVIALFGLACFVIREMRLMESYR